MPPAHAVPRTLRLLMMFVALATTHCNESSVPRQPPTIAFATTTHDFHAVEQGTPVTAVFAFRNAGGTALTIDNLKMAPDCTATLTSERVVQAGGRAAIRATFDTTRAFGPQSRTVTVYSNDPTHPFTTLRLDGVVQVDAAADPPELYVGRVRRGQRAENHARIVIGNAVALTLRPTESPVLRADLLAAAAGQSGKILAVTIKPDAPLGRFAESVTLVTSSTKHPAVTVPIFGIVESEKE